MNEVIRGAVFDVDGTLLDTMPAWHSIGSAYLRKLGIVPEQDLDSILFAMTVEEAAAYLRRAYALPQSEHEIIRGCISGMEEFYSCHAQLKKGAADLLARLASRGTPMMTVTCGSRKLQEAAMDRLGIRHFFMETVFCGERGLNKNGPAAYLYAAGQMGLEPAQILVFEDALHGIRSAKAAGFHVCAVADAASMEDRREIEETADLCVEDFTEVRLPAESRKESV